MRLKRFWRMMLVSATGLLLIAPAIFSSRPAPADSRVTVYKTPT